jgi:MmgE/PrpD C-terminal domain
MRSFLTPAFNVIAKISLSSVLPLLALTGAFPQRIPAQDNIIVNSSPAALALERFISEQPADSRTPVETIEIEASLPKLNKNGRLRAIRRTLSVHQLEYQVLELSGDSMVNHELIARYLSADKRAAELSTASTAITPANYKFRYIGSVQLQDDQTYMFRIIPRKKRQGLIDGVLWLDGDTGIAVRLSGYLVKNPSIFLKRVNVTRENYLRGGIVETRITHLLLETRLVGSARLVVVERTQDSEAQPISPPDSSLHQSPQLQPARIQAPDAQALLARVEVRPDEHFTARYPRELNARITIHTKDQRVLVKEQLGYEGGLTNPMSWNRTVEKFQWLSESFAHQDLRSRLIEAVQRSIVRGSLT